MLLYFGMGILVLALGLFFLAMSDRSDRDEEARSVARVKKEVGLAANEERLN